MESLEVTKPESTLQLESETETTKDKEFNKKSSTSDVKLGSGKSLNENPQTAELPLSTADSTKQQSSGVVDSTADRYSTKLEQHGGTTDSECYNAQEENSRKCNSIESKKDEQQHGSNNEDREPVSNHEESDYEDNIVVTVPSASDTCTDKFLSRRHGGGGGHPRPPGLDNSPKHRRQVKIGQNEAVLSYSLFNVSELQRIKMLLLSR